MRAQLVSLLLAMIPLTIGQNLRTSTSGSCAGTTGETCLGSRWGDCCSTNGFCGQNATYCGGGCQLGFGACYENANLISVDGSCGVNGTTCLGSIFGNCCSKTGFCGSSSLYCGTGCQNAFGECGDAATESASLVAASTIASTSAPTGTTSTFSSSTAAVSTTTSSASQASSTTNPTATPPRPVTSTAGFKAGMAVMAIVVVSLAISLLIYYFICRRGQPQSRATNNTNCQWPEEKQELECNTTTASVSAPASELGTSYIAELPARYSYKHGLVDERGVVGNQGTYRGH